MLTYNIEGLAWPARTGRSPALHAIGEQFAALQRSGAAPDVVMVQEMFSGPAKAAASATGYPAIVSGPRRSTASQPTGLTPLPGKARLKRGELGLRFMSSGLAIASRYPIIDSDLRAYGKRSARASTVFQHAPERWDNFSRYHALRLVHQDCVVRGSGCEVKMSWDGDAPWMDTQDLQFFASGDRVEVRPVRVEAMFDGSPASARLSDHDGFLVTYELSWSHKIAAAGGC